MRRDIPTQDTTYTTFIHNKFTTAVHDATERNERIYKKGVNITPTRNMKPTLYSTSLQNDAI
jgi:hypothetical protein